MIKNMKDKVRLKKQKEKMEYNNNFTVTKHEHIIKNKRERINKISEN